MYNDALNTASAAAQSLGDTIKATPRECLLFDAKHAVTGAREAAYGGPEQSFTLIADLWTTYLASRPGDAGAAIQPHDVAVLLALLKIARLCSSGGRHYDSWVDLAGYAACGSECIGEHR